MKTTLTEVPYLNQDNPGQHYTRCYYTLLYKLNMIDSETYIRRVFTLLGGTPYTDGRPY